VTAVIFDCDGTLVDSEPLARRAWELTLGERDYTVSDEDFAAVVGLSYAKVHDFFAQRVELPGSEAFWPEFSGALFHLIDTELRPFPDALATLADLRAAGVPVAVASSSPRERLDRTLHRVELHPHFEVTVAGDEVEHGKPQPDLFVAAAERLGADAADCVVVEDTPPGVAAGVAAGAAVVGVARAPSDRDGLGDAHVVVDELSAAVLLETAGSQGVGPQRLAKRDIEGPHSRDGRPHGEGSRP
jgi:HAD superfamily hydrolase (TIGR01509 family)